MPRRRRMRKVVAPPNFKGYRPYGNKTPSNDYVELFYEEYEALKLADFDLLNHLQAANIMGISRPTFARIYETARRKIAAALVETKEIRTVYGHALLDKNWYVCDDCQARFTMPVTLTNQACPICGMKNIEPLNKDV